MIVYLIMLSIGNVLSIMFSFLPSVTTLPYGIDPIAVQAMGYVRAMIVIFPPLGVILQAFLYYLGFRLILAIVKVILGGRAPHHD